MMSDKSISTRLFGIPAALLVLLMTGCSSTPTVSEGEIPPKRTFESVTAGDPEGKTYAIDQYDPIEGFNRRVYRFNAWFDEAIFLPVVRGYEFITPVIVQDGVSNFFSNLGEITNFTNSVLQLKPEAAATAFSRFARRLLRLPMTFAGTPPTMESGGMTVPSETMQWPATMLFSPITQPSISVALMPIRQ